MPHRSRSRSLRLRRVLASTGAVSLLAWCAPLHPVEAAEVVPIVGSETLIGELVPITGDPIETRTIDLRVEFPHDSAKVSEQAAAQLRELGAALTSVALREAELAVYGHTDSSGPADYNRALSERRANSVAVFLQSHFPIGEGRIREVRGYGESRPKVGLAPDAAAQRRVEIVVFHQRLPETVQEGEEATAPAVTEPEQVISLPGADLDEAPLAGTSAAGGSASSDSESTTGRNGYIAVE